MINITGDSLVNGWKKAFLELYKTKNINEGGLLKDQSCSLVLSNIQFGEYFSDNFPMKKDILDEYNKFIIHGGHLGNVEEEHAIYHFRLFEYGGNLNQINYIIETLKNNPNRKRAIAISLDQKTDINSKIYPCLIYIWCVIQSGKLIFHIHSRASDAYNKMLMDINIGVSIMKHISNELGVKNGEYVHIIDSLHFYEKDIEKIDELYSKIKNK